MVVKKRGNGPAKSGDDQSIDQIREIIFGQYIQLYEQRFSELEAQLKKSAGDLEKSINSQIAKLQKNLDGAAGDADSRLTTEARQRDSQLNKLGKNLEGFRMDAQNQMGDMEGDLRQALKALHTELSGTRKDLAEQTDSGFKKLERALKTQTGKLEQHKVDRKELAGFLQLMSGQIAGGTGSDK